MKPKIKIDNLTIWLFLIIVSTGCKKDWLDEKPDKSLVVPSTIADYQAILDNSSSNNGTTAVDFNNTQNSLNEIGSDDMYVLPDRFSSAQKVEQNTYIWAQDIFGIEKVYDEWKLPYKRILYSNIVLEGLDKITPRNSGEKIEWDNAKGSAYFFRAFNHYDIAQQFCKPYSESTSVNDFGIPLRLTSDFNAGSQRASVKETYDQIIQDLHLARSLIPISSPEPTADTVLNRVRPNKSAVNAMLARVYLAMEKYDSALFYANQSLQLYNTLIDYNEVLTTSNTPFGRCNKEVLFHSQRNGWGLLGSTTLIVDSLLYQMYADEDMRKSVFFRTSQGELRFKGSYARGAAPFGGLATDEMYLIRAESYIRIGNLEAGIEDINTLLSKRLQAPFTPVNPANLEEALELVLRERRKQLCFRGLRWMDLRRLNKDPRFVVTQFRKLDGQEYTLLPNSDRYILPIPDDVILITGMQQNPR